MGWTDSHLYEFRAGGLGWGAPDPDGYYDGPLPANKSSLLDVVEDVGTKTIHYIYNFGDNWHHVIKVEKIDDAIPGAAYPRLVRAIGACPPEDVGGFPIYADFVDAMVDPKHEEHHRMLEWYGKSSTLKRPRSVASSTTSSASPKSGPQNPANQRLFQNPCDQYGTSAAFGGCLRTKNWACDIPRYRGRALHQAKRKTYLGTGKKVKALKADSPAFTTMRRLAMRFKGILRGRKADPLPACIDDAIKMQWSNGQVEGQINQLKTLKRVMYCRAGPNLLRARMLPFHHTN